MNVHKILIPLDGSASAEAALQHAIEVAGVTLNLLRAAETDARSASVSPLTQLKALRDAEEYLRKVVKRLEHMGLSRIEAHVWYGPPAAAIVEAARTQKVDLIAMTTHGRSGLGRLELGSVAEAVLHGTLVPVLLVRPDGAPIEVPIGGEPAGGGFRV